MTKIRQPVEPFGDVNVLVKDNGIEIVASVLMVPDIEGAKVGLALDASVSMKKMYGVTGIVGAAFFQASATPNVMDPVTKSMASFLANFSGDGKATLIYWACNPDGSEIEPIGTYDEQTIKSLQIGGPKKKQWGRGTKLLPALQYFMEEVMSGAPWSLVVFVTDGILEDMDEIKEYCLRMGKEIVEGKRQFVKLVLLGVGEEVDESQMEELDDMFEGSGLKDAEGNEIDLWCHKLASDMKRLEEVFAEVVSENTTVASQGRILDGAGKEVVSYADGLPAKLRFILPLGNKTFTVEFPGGKIVQDISEALI